MGRWSALLLLAVGLIALDAPSVELSATPAQIAVGETVNLTVVYRWPHGWTVPAEPDPAQEFRSLYVTAAPPAERSSTGEEERRTYRYTVAATRSGAWALPRPTLTAHGSAGPVSAQAPEVIVQVGTESAPPTLPAARPLLIRPPEATRTALRWWLLGTAGVGILGVLIWLRLRRRTHASGPTPWQVFSGELDGVQGAADAKDAGARLSLAVRRYAGAIWRFDGPGLTTREIIAVLRRLKAGSIADGEARDLQRILGRLDELRWCPDEASAEAMRDLMTLARTWAGEVQRRLDAEEAERARQKNPQRATA